MIILFQYLSIPFFSPIFLYFRKPMLTRIAHAKIVVVLLTTLCWIVPAFSGQEILPYDDTRDWPAVAQICQENPVYLGAHTKSKEDLEIRRQFLQKPAFFSKVICSDQQTIGFITYVRKFEKFPKESVTGSIIWLGVAKNNQRKGYGEKLLRATLDSLKKMSVGTVSLIVHDMNTKAQALYEKCGFVRQSTARDHFFEYRLDVHE